MTQKEAAWEVLEAAYMAASANGTLPASARQIYYQARPKIMAMTDDKELPTAISRKPCCPTISRSTASTGMSCMTRAGISRSHTPTGASAAARSRSRNYLHGAKDPDIVPADFAGANVDVIGPSGNISGVLFCEKEGFDPLFKAVKLANRYDLMIVSTKGVSVTAARRLIDDVCGNYDLPLFVLHDFDVAGFLILGTLQRDTRRFQFTNTMEVVDLGLRLDDIKGLEREPAAAVQGRPGHPARAACREWRDRCRDRNPAQRARRTKRHDQRRPRRNDRGQAQGIRPRKGRS